jgi:hypothetical protein
MTRPILVLIAVGAFVSVVAGSGCGAGGVGDPCIPEQEYLPCFGGFQIGEVNVESKSFQCQTRLCLVNHFQGRVSCPYGQTAGTVDLGDTSQPTCGADNATPGACSCGTGVTGGAPFTAYPVSQGVSASQYPSGVTPSTCSIPGAATILADASAAEKQTYQVQVFVPPQVFERNTANSVYCSCRCANDQGQTNDGAVYCSCPDGYTCQQLVSSIGGTLDQGLTGGYCMKANTGYTPTQADCSTNPPKETNGSVIPGCCSTPGTCCSPTGSSCGPNGNQPCACD